MGNLFIKTEDGIELFTHIKSQGLPLVFCNGLGANNFIWKYLDKAFCMDHTIIHWDYRSHNRSQKTPLESLSVERFAIDLKDVLDAHKIKKAVLLGHSMGSQVILEFALRYPEYILGLVVLCGSYGNILKNLKNRPFLLSLNSQIKKITHFYPSIIEKLWPSLFSIKDLLKLFVRMELKNYFDPYQDMRSYFDHLSKMDIKVLLHLIEKLDQHNLRDELKNIKAPTLIISGQKDTLIPLWVPQTMNQYIPNSELLIIPQGSHVAPLEMPELINIRLMDFLLNRIPLLN